MPKAYAANATCTLALAYRPTTPGTRLGSAVLYNGSNVPILALPATGMGNGPLLTFGFGAATSLPATFNGPSSVTVDGSGNIFIADTMNNQVVELTAAGASKNVGTGFLYPVGTAVDGAGNLYVADSTHGIIKVPNENGSLNSAHQQSLAITGGVLMPSEIAFDAAGNMYIADTNNNRILKLLQVNGTLDLAHPTYPGTGFTAPEGVAVDAAGNIYVADTGFPTDAANSVYGRIVKIAPNGLSQQNLSISVSGPASIAIDASGQLYIADTENTRVLQVSSNMLSQTPLNLAINGKTQPQYFGGITLDLKGNLWAPDFMNNQVVRIGPGAPSFDFGILWTTPATSAPQATPVYNIGNTNLNIYGFLNGPPQYFYQNGGTCLLGTSVAPEASCSLSIVFTSNQWFNFQTNVPFYLLDNVSNQTSANPHSDAVTVSGSSLF